MSVSGVITLLAAKREGRHASTPKGYRIALGTTAGVAALAGLGLGLGGWISNSMCFS